MTTQFSALTEQGARDDSHQIAVAISATETRRMLFSVLLAGLTGDQTGPEIVTLLAALGGTARLNASALQLIADALDVEIGTAWRTGGASDGVLSALALANDGEVTATIQGGTDFTAQFATGINALITAASILESQLPSTITRDSELAAYAALAGATFTGAVAGLDPTAAQEFVTQAYGDANYTGGGGTPLTTTIKQPVVVGGPVNVNINFVDRFFDSGIDMPATADIADDDTFVFSIQYRLAGNPRLQLLLVSGVEWKAMVALTATQLAQTSFTAGSADKTITGFFRRTSDGGGQAQQNAYFAKGTDGVSLYVGDNNDSFDSTVTVWKNADAPITGLQGPAGAVGTPNLHGAGTPADTLGVDDQWYLNTDDGAWFQKASGTWGTAVYTDQLGQAGTLDGVINSLALSLSGSDLTATAGTSTGGTVSNATALPLPFLPLAGGTLTGLMTGTAVTLSGLLTGATAMFSGAVGAVSITLSAALTAASAVFSGAITAGSATVTGVLTGSTATFSGLVSAATAPTADAHLANKLYVDNAVAGMMTPTPTDDFYFGTSTDATPQGSEATVAGINGTGTIFSYTGDMHLLIFRLESEADITRVLFSTDSTQTNQIGAFTKFGSTVIPTGETLPFEVWVTNQAVSNPAGVAITAS